MSDSKAAALNHSTEPDLTGRELGEYRILRRLGRGAMAVVYLAEQLSLRRQVALKVLKSDLANDQKYVRRFHHEAQAVASRGEDYRRYQRTTSPFVPWPPREDPLAGKGE